MEDAFGEQAQMLLGDHSAMDVMEAMEWLCRDRAAELRAEAALHLHRAVRHMRLRAEAEALEKEAATWCLLRHLYVEGPVAHGGPAVPGAGQATTLRQRAAVLLQEDPELDVMARVVSWLEALAAHALDEEEAASGRVGSYAGRFASKEALWLETRNKIARRTGSSVLVTELDPDAPTRQWRKIDGENAKTEEQLMARCWRLIRAGRMDDAIKLCEECGEPYRAGSWGACSFKGLVCAFPKDEGLRADQQLSYLAAEEESGPAAMHCLSRWTAFQASEQLAEAVAKTGGGCGGGMYEAAIYAALCGHLHGMLRVCKTWEDHCWARFRASMEVSLDRQLAAAAASASTKVDAALDIDNDAGALLGAAPATGRASEPAAMVASQITEVMKGHWPLDAVSRAAPGSIGECLEGLQELSHLSGDTVFTLLQMDLVLAAASQEHGSPHGAVLDRLRAQVQGCVSRIQSKGLSGLRSEEVASEEHLIRFAAHLALVLEHLDAHELGEEDYTESFSALSNARNTLLECYIVQLMQEKQHKLVPLYACKLRPGLREKVYGFYLDSIDQDAEEDCASVFEVSRDCFRINGVVGADGEDEMHRLVEAFAASVRSSLAGGPARKVSATRWLTYGEEMLGAAVRHINSVCLNLLLSCGADLCAELGSHLLSDMLPEPIKGGLQELQVELQARPASEVADGRPSRNDLNELIYWREYFEALDKAKSCAEQQGLGDPSSEVPADSRAQAAVLAGSVATSLSDVVRSGWMQRFMDWDDGEFVSEDYIELTVVPAAVGPTAPSDYPAMVPELAAQLAESITALWSQELGPWLEAKLGGEVAAFLTASPDAPAGDPQRSVVRVELELQATAAGVSASHPRVCDAVARMLAALVKGKAPTDRGHDLHNLPLLVVTFLSSQQLACALARHVAVPRMILQSAELRAASAASKRSLDGLPDLAAVVADPKDMLHTLFVAEELQDLLRWERETAIAAG
uniref:Nuclear pore complex protein n=1 Tax=Tetraselmis sp. GSL018 TaxID=582737 RepID=A0A061R3Y7_9CHLO